MGGSIKEEKTTWQESLKFTTIFMFYIVLFWFFLLGTFNIGLHFYEIKTSLGFGGQIL